MQGGNFKHGFISGLVSAGGGYGMMKSGVQSKFVLVSANAVIGGTASELGGGKFANGAITGAFVILFNDLAHDEKEENKGLFRKLENKLDQYAQAAGNSDAIGFTFSFGVSAIFGVDGDLFTVVKFLNGPDSGNFVIYSAGSYGASLVSIYASGSVVLFYYQGDINNFDRNSLEGPSNDKSMGYGLASYTRSNGEYVNRERVVTHSLSISGGVGIPVTIGNKKTITKLWRPFRINDKK